MLKRISHKAILAIAISFSSVFAASAQEGAYVSFTPYSVFGVGDLANGGNAYTNSMGGVGFASRNNRFINPINPAAITARDSLSFMIDFSLAQNNRYFRQGDRKSINNTFNISNCAVTFPIYKSLTVMAGIGPYSSVGYTFSEYYNSDNAPIAQTGNIGYAFLGSGNIYQLYAAVAGSFFKKRLSVGAEWIHYFGKIEKSDALVFYNETLAGNSTETFLNMKSNSLKLGLQYTQPVGETSNIVFGAAYKLKSKMKGEMEYYGLKDSLEYNISDFNAYFAGELGIGLAYNYKDKFRAEINYHISDWSDTGIDKVSGLALDNSKFKSGSTFTTTKAQDFRMGFEFTPNRTDIRYYFKRCTYRAGAFYKTDYFKVDGNTINSYGITLGATLPVFRWSNGLTLAAEIGQRASNKNNLVRERYVNFSIGFNLYDIWFQKIKYE